MHYATLPPPLTSPHLTSPHLTPSHPSHLWGVQPGQAHTRLGQQQVPTENAQLVTKLHVCPFSCTCLPSGAVVPPLNVQQTKVYEVCSVNHLGDLSQGTLGVHDPRVVVATPLVLEPWSSVDKL